MRRIRLATAIAGLCAAITSSTSGTSFAEEPITQDPIASCLALPGKEAVLTKDEVRCVKYRKGDDEPYISAVPWNLDMNAICDNRDDRRRMDGNAIKKLAANQAPPVSPTGIRILGAVFCETLDLVGLDLKYSVILDRSVFRNGIEVRNVRIQGDLSFEKGLIFGITRILRSQITGSIFADGSYIENFVALDSTIGGQVALRNGVVPRALVDNMNISGELSVSKTALSTFLIQFSTIRGPVDVSNSEARCWYQIRKSELGELVAADVRFGRLSWTPWDVESEIGKNTTRISTSLAVQQLDGLPIGCRVKGEEFAFVLYEIHIRSSLCVRSFNPIANEPSLRYLNLLRFVISSTKVEGNAIINLRPEQSAKQDADTKPRFEIAGFKAGSLILNFSDNVKPTNVNGLQFDRVYHSAHIECTHASFKSDGDFLTKESRITFINESELREPTSDEVRHWIPEGMKKSTQPFSAFITAFENAGADASDLRVERKTRDLCRKTPSGLPFVPCLHTAANVADSSAPPQISEAGSDNVVARAWEFVSTVFQWVLYRLADHGVRPGKVVGPLLLVMLFFIILFRYGLKIIGFEVKEKTAAAGGRRASATHSDPPKLWPLGPLFLFDHLVPLYKIREEHYAVGKYFRLARSAEIAAAKQGANNTVRQMRRFWRTRWVRPATEAETDRAERSLVVLRIVGAVLAIFLAAAITALTRG